jgi:hypothetical protein
MQSGKLAAIAIVGPILLVLVVTVLFQMFAPGI